MSEITKKNKSQVKGNLKVSAAQAKQLIEKKTMMKYKIFKLS
jgi:hypothetical protein